MQLGSTESIKSFILNIKNCRTLNLLPALLVPPAWFLLKGLFAPM